MTSITLDAGRARADLIARLRTKTTDASSSRPAGSLPRTDRTAPLCLSWDQQRLWFLDQFDPAAGAAYSLAAGYGISGPLDRALFQRSLDLILARHESLRTRFVSHEGQACAVVETAERGFPLTCTDALGYSADERARIIERTHLESIRQRFDLAEGLLVRGHLLRLSEQEHAFLLYMHHIVSDGWSITIFLQELQALYTALAAGQASPLEDLPVQYVDYAAWQRDHVKGLRLERQLAFWRKHLSGAPELLELPTDRPRPPVPSYAGGSVRIELPPGLVRRLAAFSRQQQATLFMTLLTAWSVLLSRLSRQSDIVVGVPVANRPHSDLEPLIGFFVNTLALRIDLERDPALGDLIGQVRTTVLEAFSHQEAPFDQVVDAVRPSRDPTRNPLFQVMFAFDVIKEDVLHFSGLEVRPLDLAQTTADFDLSLALRMSGDTIHGHLNFASDLFDSSTAERIAGHFLTLLDSLEHASATRVSKLPLLSAQETAQILAFNPEPTAAFPDRLLHDLIEARADLAPLALAVSCDQYTITYGELNDRANRIAHRLIEMGICPDDRVGLHVGRSVAMVVGMLGILKAGGAYVPLDPAYPPERLAYMVGDSRPVAIIGQQAGPFLETDGAVPILLLDQAGHATGFTDLPSGNPLPCRLGLQPHHLAYVIYTSGSTGQPKGVMIEHASVANLVCQQISQFALAETDRVLQFASIGFDISVEEIFSTLAAGAHLVIRPERMKIPDADFIAFIDRHRISLMNLPTAFWQHWAQDIALGRNVPKHAPRFVAVGGEQVLRHHVEEWLSHPDLAAGKLVNIYGPTETTVSATAHVLTQSHATPSSTIPIGKPLPNYQAYVLDSAGRLVPIGAIGEIHIAGKGVARGYLDRPALTTARFVPNPFDVSSGSRMYKTGDLGRWLPDGSLEFIGRNDDQVKIRGFRIELGEIEAMLHEHAAVRAAVVVVWEGDRNDKRLVAYAAPQDGRDLAASDLQGWLAGRLPDYMVPSIINILPSLPLTPNGKVARQALPKPAVTIQTLRPHVPPRGRIETAIAAAWKPLLGAGDISRHDNFFELGGHSLMAVQFLASLHRTLGIDIALRDVFSHPVLADLAAHIERGSTHHHHPNLVPLRPAGSALPLFCLHPGEGEVGYARALAQWLDPELPVYGLAATGFQDGERPACRLSEMAASYLEGIRSVQAHGPYRLVGWSAGGTIAYEIARRLQAAGETIAYLGLIDTTADYSAFRPASQQPEADIPGLEVVLSFLETDDQRSSLRCQVKGGALRTLDDILLYCQLQNWLPTDIGSELILRHQDVRNGILEAVLDYRPQRIEVPVYLYIASDEERRSPDLGWSRILGGHLNFRPLSGTHYTIVEEPAVGKLADAISVDIIAHSRQC